MKKTTRYVILILLILGSGGVRAQLNKLAAGPYKVGFKTVWQADAKGKPLVIGVWYPASGGGEKMSLRSYITARALTKEVTDTASLNYFKRVLELPFLYNLEKVPATEYNRVVAMPFKGYKNATAINKKFPLVIASASPDNYPATFEYLASHGFVVASVNAAYKDAPNDTLLWVEATDHLQFLLNYMIRQPHIDTARIAAFGHGGGIQSAFYLCMRTPKVKLLMNLDGGVLGDGSKTTLSPDYKPAMLKAPMLHIITRSEERGDNPKQWDTLSNPRYRVVIRSEEVRHHDFIAIGIVVAEALHKRGESTKLIEDVFAGVHITMLQFLQRGKLTESDVNQKYFEYSAAGL